MSFVTAQLRGVLAGDARTRFVLLVGRWVAGQLRLRLRYAAVRAVHHASILSPVRCTAIDLTSTSVRIPKTDASCAGRLHPHAAAAVYQLQTEVGGASVLACPELPIPEHRVRRTRFALPSLMYVCLYLGAYFCQRQVCMALDVLLSHCPAALRPLGLKMGCVAGPTTSLRL